MRALVTGAGGKVGTALLAALRAAGGEPVGLGHGALDVTRADEVREAFDRHRPDAVFHCAAYTSVDAAEESPEEARAVNVGGARNVAEGCARLGARLLHLSTDFVFSGEPGRPWREDDPTCPAGAYARSKEEGEREVLGVYPAALVVRAAWIYGGRGPDFVGKILERARSGARLRVVEDQVGSPTWVSDLAGALAAIGFLDPPPAGILHVANAGACSRLDLARAALEEAGLRAPVEAIRSADLPPGSAPRPCWTVLDTSRHARLAGTALRPWREALHACLQGEVMGGG